jgi:putative transposase
MTPQSVHYCLAAGMRVIRQDTLDAAFAANPNGFKNKRPVLSAIPTAAWINPPPKETPQPLNLSIAH